MKRRFDDWERVREKDGDRAGVVGNYHPEMRKYLVGWDDGDWDYVSVNEIVKESDS